MVDATATATADDTANCPAPPRGSALRSSGSDKKSGRAIGWTHSAGNAPERLNTAPNFQPDTHGTEGLRQSSTQSYKSTHTWVLGALKPPSVLITICLSSNSRSMLHLNKSDLYLHAFVSHLQDLTLRCGYADNLVHNTAFGLIIDIDIFLSLVGTWY